MPQGLKNFIAELRTSGEARKKRYLVIGSAITMSVVVFLWMGYLNINVQNVSDTERTDAAPEIQKNDFWETMKRGSAILYDQIADLIGKGINQKKEIIIDTKENFQSGELAPITPQEIK
ncbi:MAG TPA: hypothetical protein VJK04_03790 [Candidatus Paceibacterota bacterium]